jgi:hypothetical protein
MPAFSFEKLSPPLRRETVPVTAAKPHRGLIVQMLDRLTEARLRRTERDISAEPSRPTQPDTRGD